MIAYIDSIGNLVEVVPGIGGRFWIVARRTAGDRAHHRLKSPHLPPRDTADEAEADLEKYAERKGWKHYER